MSEVVKSCLFWRLLLPLIALAETYQYVEDPRPASSYCHDVGMSLEAILLLVSLKRGVSKTEEKQTANLRKIWEQTYSHKCPHITLLTLQLDFELQNNLTPDFSTTNSLKLYKSAIAIKFLVI